MSEIEDRRQRAREAAHDVYPEADWAEVIEAAIEAATRVQITDETVIEYRKNLNAALSGGRWISDKHIITVALRTAGFEVVE